MLFSRSPASTVDWRPWFFLVVGVVGIALALKSFPAQIDDAFIAYRYAAHFAAGHGLVFNDGGPPVEGFSSPAWLLLLSASALFLGKAVLPKAGMLLGLAAWVMIGLTVWRAFRNQPWWQGGVAWVLLAGCPAVTFYAATGMESLLFLWVVLVAALSAAGLLPFWLGLLAGMAAPWVRPEAPLLIGVCLLAGWRGGLSFRHAPLVLCAGLLLSYATLLALRWMLFADVLPNTYYAKTPHIPDGINYVFHYLTRPWGGFLLVAGAAGAWFGGGMYRRWFVAALFWMAGVIMEGGDWMPQGRLLLPAWGLLALSSTGILAGAKPSAGRWGLALVMLAGVVSFGVPAQLAEARKAWNSHISIGQDSRLLAKWLGQAKVASVGLVDIGETGFWADASIFDFGGLTDKVIARAPGGLLSKQFDRDYLFEKSRPAILVIRLARLPKEASGRLIPEAGDTYDEVERHVMRDARLEKDYWLRTVIMPGYNREPWYGLAVYQRRDVVLDPAGAWLPERLYQKPPV